MTKNGQTPRKFEGRVLMFPARVGRRRSARSSGPPRERVDTSIVADLSKFERVRDRDDYRQRMINNVLALLLTLALIAAGIWLAQSIASLRKDEDCVLSGRRDCVPIQVPMPGR